MDDLLKALMRSNWSASVRGLRGTAGWVATTTGMATEGQVRDLSRALYQAGDQINTGLVDALRDCLRAEGLSQNARSALDVSTASTRLLRQDRIGRAARQELANRLEVFQLVRYETPDFAGSERAADDLRRAVVRAYERDEHRALWLVEGLAHKFVLARLEKGERPQGLFVTCPEGLPASSSPMLHAGLGLATAEYLLERFSPSPGNAQGLIRTFLDVCRANADPEQLDAALEALGLVARCFYPDTLASLNDALPTVAAEQDPELEAALYEMLWHGAGRGVYFIPLSFVPGYGSIERAMDTVEHEAPDAVARDAAMAGLGYAFNMVNMAHPEVLEVLLRERGKNLGNAFARGLLAAFVARHDVTPDYPLLQPFLDHRAGGVDDLWESLVREPCRRVLAADTPEQRREILGDLYRSLGH